MASGSGIAFWEILNVHRSRLDSFPTCLDGLKHPALVLSCCLFLVLMPICFSTFSRAGSLKEDRIRTRVALKALVTVLVPTCSLWPSRYIGLASASRFHIDIPLEVIIKDTIDGVIEFRNPSNDLVDLIGSGRIVNRHIICISIGWKWWIKYFKWWMLAKVRIVHHTRDI
ncbi:hypothetical protein L210DRAFT_848828 [Boletus edulis BED1]|uniref:Uncharacterized protein n=1 Tax=Boletus edulis BED1 TaxID=1328754 RepID=A0AAD4C3Y7_BOLED|nr:hypothetical protein L210DRAFT_848828 [Boletus edulis BED1]